MSSFMKDEEVKEVVFATIAKQILEGLNTETRDVILQKTLIEVIKDYKFKNAIKEVAAEKATVIAERLMNEPEWIQQVETTIKAGMVDYLRQLRLATVEMLKVAYNGSTDRGSYYAEHCGTILNVWPKEKE